VFVAPSLTFRTIAIFTGAIALPLVASRPNAAVTASGATPSNNAVVANKAAIVAHSNAWADFDKYVDHKSDRVAADLPDVGCLARTVCAIKNKIRWQTPAWTSAQCQTVASAVLTSSKRHNVSPSLLLAVMINESDLNETSARVTMKENKIYAKDSGLTAIRCVLDKHNHCMNGNVRGLAWTDVMDPATNIELGAKELAYWKNGGAVTRTVVKIRDSSGVVRPVFRNVPCKHKDHAYWAHYNHGPHYIAQGYPRHYPHRVAVIDHALATVMNVDAPELRGRITIHDAGKRERTADRPMEARYKKLCSQIQSVGTCSAVALN
jgi:hypothetical protein